MSDTNAVDLHGDTVNDEQSSAPTGGAATAEAHAPRAAGTATEAARGPIEEVEDGLDGTADVDDDADADGAGDEDPDGDEDAPGGPGRRSGRRNTPSLRRLEEEGEVAADYLEELLDIVDLDGDIDIDVENGRASVAVVAESGVDRELASLVGPEGEVLEALQELSRLAVQARTGERSRLMLDVAGFRAARRRTLEGVAVEAVERVRRDAAPVRLDPMSAFERKVVHDVVAREGLLSESEGAEPARRVVGLPASV